MQKRNRHHVHLSADRDTAMKVGARHGVPIILMVQSGQMHREEGFEFFFSKNDVWLTEEVPMKYF